MRGPDRGPRGLSFWERTEPGDGGCVVWKRYRTPFGHGVLSVKKKTRYAHHVAYELSVGEITDGMCVLHHCDNPSCVNPRHLYLGTHADNMRDVRVRGRGIGKHPTARGATNPHAKMNEEAVKVFRFLRGKKTATLMARLYGTSATNVVCIQNGHTWSHIP